MGQILSEPITSKETIVAKNETYYVASTSMQGWRVSMEDSHSVLLEVPDDKTATYFGVFDGHGGSAVSMYASRHLHKRILEQHSYKEGDYKRAIEEGYLALDAEMLHDERIGEEMGGSTAVIALIKDNKIYCGNAGDSRAIAYTSHGVISLSNDHKPTAPEERTRITEAGAFVEFNRVNGNLAVSRALGDFLFKKNRARSPRQQAVTCFPEVYEKSLDSDWQFIVLACDGIWDVMTSNEVGDFIRHRMDSGYRPEEIVEQLVTTCLAPDGHMGGIGSDNMTVVLVVFLNNVSQAYLDALESNEKVSPKEDVPEEKDLLKGIDTIDLT